MASIDEYVTRFQIVADELAAEGAGQTRIVAALIEVIVQLAYDDRQWAPDMLEGVAGLLTEAVEAARSLKNLDDLKRRRS